MLIVNSDYIYYRFSFAGKKTTWMMEFSWRRLFKIRISGTFFTHIFCWIIFIAYELATVYYALGRIDKPFVYLIYYPIHITYFYCYVRILDNTFKYPEHHYLKGLFLFILLVAVYLLIKFSADLILTDKQLTSHNPYFYIQGLMPRTLARGLYFTALATFYWSAGHIGQFRKRAADAENRQLTLQKEKAELETLFVKARNAYLQQQMNPHMLFNTLNFIYNKVENYSEDAAHCVWLLSEIMRFSLEDTNEGGTVIVQKEIDQVFNLIEINRYRFDQPLYLQIETEGDFSRYRVIPLILLTLTENIFKHGRLTEREHPATLNIAINDDGRLQFYSCNLSKTNVHAKRKQLGLQNTRIRLDSVYPGNYEFNFKEQDGFFTVRLTMNLCN